MAGDRPGLPGVGDCSEVDAMQNDEPSAPADPVPNAEPQFTLRSVFTGMVLGGALSLCNIYTGLKVGWGLGMSITAALIAFGFWRTLGLSPRVRGFNIYETNISQTAASSGAAISSAGLVAPIPALAMITGQTLGWGALVIWTFSVCLVGIVVAMGLRRQLIEVDKLTFPNGVATGETLREIYARGGDAVARVSMLVTGAVGAAALKVTEHLAGWTKLAIPGAIPVRAGSALEKTGHGSVTLANLGFSIEPTALMYAVGVLVGPRVGISLFLGTVVAWGWLAPMAFHHGWAEAGPQDPLRSWYGAGLKWLLWPGVAMMVTAALTSFAFSWRSVVNAFVPARRGDESAAARDEDMFSKRTVVTALVVVMGLSVVLQAVFFAIQVWVAVVGVLVTFALALVAARVSGETNVTPVGAMGKVTQLFFAVLAPGQPAANLMAANVTGGAASQCADLMHDLKTGHMIGARPKLQFSAQVFGALAGALAGCAGYLVLVPDPASMLLTDEWPAPAVASWKAVAEIFMKGLDALPTGAVEGMAIGGAIGIVLAVLERTLPGRWRLWVPSAPSLGLALVIPAYNAISMFIGSVAGWGLSRAVPKWSARFLIVLASGIIAGESLTGVGFAIQAILTGG